MKKLLYVFFAITSLFLGACSEDFDDWASPITNPQEELITIPGITANDAPAIDLANSEGTIVPVFILSAATLPEGVTLGNARMEITPAGQEGATPIQVNTSADGQANVEDLQTIIENIFGKRPIEHTFNAVVILNAIKDGQSAFINAGTVELKVTPSAPVISSAYYLVGDMFGWDAEHMQKFNHSDKDVYEDPVFTLIFTTTADNQYWKIIPQENVDAQDGFWADPGVVGVAVDGDDSMEGTLINEKAQAGKIAKAGMYSMTLNMMDYSYTIKEIVPEYYVVGAMQGWNKEEEGMTCMLYPQSKMVHSYTTKYEGDANLKLWLGSDFGNWDVCFGSATNDDNSAAGSLVSTGAGAIICPEKGAYYTFTADFSSMSYTWTKLTDQAPAEYTQISLIGDFNGWGGDADMQQVTPHNWYIAGLEVSAGGIKFRENHDWTTSWGGNHVLADQNYGVAEASNDNLTITAGTYNVFFNDITKEFVFKAVN